MTSPGPEPLPPYLRLVLAPNPGVMTLDGTNTWVVGDPGRAAPVVVDPGPLDAGHLQAVLDACRGRVAAIVLTHRHADHSDGAAELSRAAGCPVLAADPALQRGPEPLAEGVELVVPGARLRAVATPGHTSDSFSLLVEGEDGVTRLATGDTVLGRGTTVIAHPDGSLRSYLGSLTVLAALVRSARVTEILPGHGPRVADPGDRLAWYRAHRLERLQQVREALAAGAGTPAEVVALAYADVDPSVRAAAERSVAAQLAYLAEEG